MSYSWEKQSYSQINVKTRLSHLLNHLSQCISLTPIESSIYMCKYHFYMTHTINVNIYIYTQIKIVYTEEISDVLQLPSECSSGSREPPGHIPR